MLSEGEASLYFSRNGATEGLNRDSSTPLRSAQNDKRKLIKRSSGSNLGDFRRGDCCKQERRLGQPSNHDGQKPSFVYSKSVKCVKDALE
jgi:hypothetical protein